MKDAKDSTKLQYNNRFFLSDDKHDSSYINCSVGVKTTEYNDCLESSFDASLHLYDGYNEVSLSAYSYVEGDKDVDEFIKKLYGLRDACNTLIEKCEEGVKLHEKYQKKISKK